MDPQERIVELENRLRRMTGVVESLLDEREEWLRQLAEHEHQGGEVATGPAPPAHSPVWQEAQHIASDMRRNVERVLGGEPGETIEARIGGIWLSRVAVILAMTAIILGAAVTVASERFGALEALALIFGVSLAGIAYGIGASLRQRPHLFARNILGLGLAGLYYGVYAAFFVDNLRLFEPSWLVVPPLAACLLLLAAVSAWTRSRAVAGIGLFLVYYTVLATLIDIPTTGTYTYALGTLGALALIVLGLTARYHWLGLVWLAAFASYGVFFAFFWQRPSAFPLDETGFFWVTHAVLALNYAAIMAACVWEVRRGRRKRRGMLVLALFNSAALFVFTLGTVEAIGPGQVWIFRALWTVSLLLFALWAETRGEHRNLLFQLLLFKAALMANLALAAYLQPPWLLIAFSVECLVFALAYQRAGVVTLKVMNLAMLGVALVGSLLAYRTIGYTTVLSYSLPIDWLGTGAASACFLAGAVFYERAVRRIKPGERTRSGQWFLADSWLDLPPATISMMHASAAALALTGITVANLGELNELPFLLAGIALALAAIGVLTHTPQIAASSMLPLVAANVSFHFFLLILDKPGFESQRFFIALSVALALVSFLGALFWERYLRRIQCGNGWEHDFSALPPFVLATVLLSILIERNFSGLVPAIGHNALGLFLLGVGLAFRLNALNLAGLVALAVGGGTFLLRLTDPNLNLTTDPYFLAYLGLMLLTFAAAERLFAVIRGGETAPHPLDDGLRSAFVTAAAFVGVIAILVWASDPYRTLSWSALALGAMAMGVILREARYRWAALVVFALVTVHFFATDLARLTRLQQFLVVAILAAVFLAVSWAYARFRQTGERPSGDGTS